jgi:hypothetical protein
MKESEYEEKRSKMLKEIEVALAKFEITGLKLLIAFKCIKCSRIFDDTGDDFEHSFVCNSEGKCNDSNN